jgi:hypothetical protein
VTHIWPNIMEDHEYWLSKSFGLSTLGSAVVLEDMVWVLRRLEDLKKVSKVLGLGLVKLVLRLKSCNFQDL